MPPEDDEILQNAQARVGAVLRNKYKLLRVIGVGGMATVYEAVHRNGRHVAVKMLHAHMALSHQARRRFVKEGYASNAIGHPGVIQAIDDDQSEHGETFVVMELLTGSSLDAVWRSNNMALPAPYVASVAFHLLDILQAAHDKGILHRDIKPENVFVTESGQVKLVDFGVARMRRSALSGPGTVSGTPVGTPMFMAPELAMGKASEIDERIDVFGVGALMFTVLSGRYVHDGETITEILVKAATQPVVPLSSVAARVPRELAHLVDRALAFDRANRWPSAAAMRDALSAVQDAMLAGASQSMKAELGTPWPISSSQVRDAPSGPKTHTPDRAWSPDPAAMVPAVLALGDDEELATEDKTNPHRSITSEANQAVPDDPDGTTNRRLAAEPAQQPTRESSSGSESNQEFYVKTKVWGTPPEPVAPRQPLVPPATVSTMTPEPMAMVDSPLPSRPVLLIGSIALGRSEVIVGVAAALSLVVAAALMAWPRPAARAPVGYLTITCEPQCDSAAVDGTDLGPAPWQRRPFAPGTHEVTLKAGGNSRVESVTILSGQEQSRTVGMR